MLADGVVNMGTSPFAPVAIRIMGSVLALTFGFTFVMACGVVCYGLGVILVKGTKRTSPKLSAIN